MFLDLYVWEHRSSSSEVFAETLRPFGQNRSESFDQNKCNINVSEVTSRKYMWKEYETTIESILEWTVCKVDSSSATLFDRLEESTRLLPRAKTQGEIWNANRHLRIDPGNFPMHFTRLLCTQIHRRAELPSGKSLRFFSYALSRSWISRFYALVIRSLVFF